MNVLSVNAGSSSLKAAAIVVGDSSAVPRRVAAHSRERIGDDPGHVAAFRALVEEFRRDGFAADAVAHRIVHGGPDLLDHAVVDGPVRAALDRAASLAPLHVPAALAVLDAAREAFPGIPQVACLDTAFHRDLPLVARRLPIPAALDARGIRRYGFHGLSYEYLVYRLGDALGPRTVLAHLGNGASLAAVRDGVGIDTTMGFTPSGGLVMGTRTGDIDPGVLVHLLRGDGWGTERLERAIDQESGLLGISGRSADARDLLDASATGDADAALALESFETAAAKHVAALTTVLGGLDTLVFTGGIGEHAAPIRAGIARRLAHLGVALDDVANARDAPVVSVATAPVTVRVEPTDEETMMALHAARLVSA